MQGEKRASRSFPRIQDRAKHRWFHILQGLGFSREQLSGKHGPCPLCGGKDRFRWTNINGNGTYFCNNEGTCGPGTGVDLVMKFLNVKFVEAKREIEKLLPDAPMTVEKAVDRKYDPAKSWAKCLPIQQRDPAAIYLRSRGIVFGRGFPDEIRFTPRAGYPHRVKGEGTTFTYHPALVSRFLSPDGESMTIQRIYLDEKGRLADVPEPKLTAAGEIPKGGAVRLGKPGEVMGVSEGVVTALSASRLFGVPTWATLSANGMLKWEPPQGVKKVFIFGDRDDSYAGQHKAFGLAYRLRQMGIAVTVELPAFVGDWNDALARSRAPLGWELAL